MSGADLREAARFLDLMAEGEPITFQTFSDSPAAKARKSKAGDSLARILHGTVEQHAQHLQHLQAKGSGVWWMVNYGDGRGRGGANVTGVRALFLDLDGSPLAPVLAAGVEPHAVVESSPGRWHVYWLVEGCELGQFEAAQNALAAKFDGDKSMDDLPQVLRVPGFWHLKGEPFMVRIEHLGQFQPYAFDDLVQRLGLDVTSAPPLPNAQQRADDNAMRDPVFRRLQERGMVLGKHRAPGFFNVVCPRAREHSTVTADSSTVYMLPNYGGQRWGKFHCLHSHCADRDLPQFIEALGLEPRAVYREQAGQVDLPMKGGAADSVMVQPFDQFTGARTPVFWAVQNMIQRGYVYSLTARWGAGKTAVTLPLGMHVACGLPFASFKVAQVRVLYMAGENPDDVRLRALQAARVYEMDCDVLAANMVFTSRSLDLTAEEQASALLARMAAENIGLVIVDTGIAHSQMEEENSNSEMHALAVALRRLSVGMGGAAVVCLMHPPHGATRDNLRTRGGGAFAGEIDGELLLWQDEDTKQVELFHSSKLRGPGFASVFFDLRRHEVEGLTDNFGDPVMTVVAVPAESPELTAKNVPRETPAQRRALQTLMLACRTHLAHDADGKMRGVHVEDWRQAYYSQSTADTQDAKRQAFHRMRTALQDAGLVRVEDDYYLPTDVGRMAALALTPRLPTDQFGERDSVTHPKGGVTSRPGQPVTCHGDVTPVTHDDEGCAAAIGDAA